MAQPVKSLPARQETQAPSLGLEDPLEKGIAIHTCILAQEIPWTEEPGGLQSMRSQKSQTHRHDWVTNIMEKNPKKVCVYIYIYITVSLPAMLFCIKTVKITYLNSTHRVFLTGPSPACWLGTSPKLYLHPDSQHQDLHCPSRSSPPKARSCRGSSAWGWLRPTAAALPRDEPFRQLSSLERPSSSPCCLGMK